MAKYTLIASRDPFDSKDVAHYYNLAGDLNTEGHEVTLFLVQNGVFAARKSGASNTIADLAGRGVAILADSFSLRERGIGTDRLSESVKPAELDVVVDHLAEGRKVIWH